MNVSAKNLYDKQQRISKIQIPISGILMDKVGYEGKLPFLSIYKKYGPKSAEVIKKVKKRENISIGNKNNFLMAHF